MAGSRSYHRLRHHGNLDPTSATLVAVSTRRTGPANVSVILAHVVRGDRFSAQTSDQFREAGAGIRGMSVADDECGMQRRPTTRGLPSVVVDAVAAA